MSLTKRFKVPSFVHEVFGETQTWFDVGCVSLFTAASTGYIWWKSEAVRSSWVSTLVIADIFAGCVANFSRGTNDHYMQAGGETRRLMFYAAHFHIFLVAYFSNVDLREAAKVWALTLASALTANTLKGTDIQTIAAGTLLMLGNMIVLPELDMPEWFRLVAGAFFTKVAFSFTVDHHRGVKAE